MAKVNSIQSVICSNNPKIKTKVDYVSLNCSSNLLTNKSLSTASSGNNFKVLCPAYCNSPNIDIFGIGQ
jgi:hypothetical protein